MSPLPDPGPARISRAGRVQARNEVRETHAVAGVTV